MNVKWYWLFYLMILSQNLLLLTKYNWKQNQHLLYCQQQLNFLNDAVLQTQ